MSTKNTATPTEMVDLEQRVADDRAERYISPGGLVDVSITLRKLPHKLAMDYLADFRTDTRERLEYILAGNVPTATRDRFGF